MSDTPYIGEIAIFPYPRGVPSGWAWCDGSAVSIAQNETLYAVIGTTYGGDGQTTFNLPNLNGRVPVGAGQGPGLSSYVPGQVGGQESVTLSQSQLPAHTHPLWTTGTATSASPAAALPAPSETEMWHTSGEVAVTLPSAGAVGPTAHNNMQPYLSLTYAIALVGIYPAQG